MRKSALLCCLCALQGALPLAAQTDRAWAPDERILITSYDDILALASGPRVIWAAAEAGIAVLDFGAGRWQAPLAPLDGWPESGSPSALAHETFGDRLWLGTESGVLHRHVLGDDRWERAGFTIGEPILRIIPDAGEGVLWIGSPSGWYRVRDDGRTGRFLLRESEIPAEVRRQGEDDPVLRAAEGTLGLDARLRRFPITTAVAAPGRPERFVGTQGGGLLRFDPNTLTTEWLPFGTLSRGVGAVAVIGERIWFGGDGQGPRDGVAAASADLTDWVRHESGVEGAPRGYVARIVAAANGIWFAASDGVFHLSAEAAAGRQQRPEWRHLTTAEGLPADQATTVLPLADATWIGTLRGAARVDGTGAVATLLPGRRVLDLASIGGEVWLATDQGLFRAAGSGAAPSRIEGAPSGVVVAVSATPAGAAVLTPDALHFFDGRSWLGPEREPASWIGGLLRLVADENGTTWIAGEEGVAARSPDGRWRWWRVPQDIPAAPIRGIAIDGDDLWVATPAGALRLDLRR